MRYQPPLYAIGVQTHACLRIAISIDKEHPPSLIAADGGMWDLGYALAIDAVQGLMRNRVPPPSGILRRNGDDDVVRGFLGARWIAMRSVDGLARLADDRRPVVDQHFGQVPVKVLTCVPPVASQPDGIKAHVVAYHIEDRGLERLARPFRVGDLAEARNPVIVLGLAAPARDQSLPAASGGLFFPTLSHDEHGDRAHAGTQRRQTEPRFERRF